jgi:hypothetical protein
VIAAVIVGFVFPILVGTFESLAWLAALLFSFLWAVVVYCLVWELAGKSAAPALLAGLVFFVVSFTFHKHYSGLSFQELFRQTKKSNIESTGRAAANMSAQTAVMFCPKCGRRVQSDGRCDFCDK